MDNANTFDFLDFDKNKDIKKIIGDESILYSGRIIKVNRFNLSSERNLLITTQNIYNIKKKSLKRKIEFNKILGITLSTLTDEFIVHLKELDNDLYYVSIDRPIVVTIIAKLLHKLTKTHLKISVLEEKSLKNYVTFKKEKKKSLEYSHLDLSKLVNTKEYLDSIKEEILKINRKDSEKYFDDKKVDDKEEEDDDEGEIDLTQKRLRRASTIYCKHKDVKAVCLDDFKVINVIGRGSFGKVCLVEFLPTKELYAMKSLKKDVLLEKDQIESTLLEKKILQLVDHPFLVSMIFCFQTEERIYFVLPFIRGGELFQHLKNYRYFDEDKVRFYSSIIGLGLQHMHSQGIIYRDIKPENILMDEEGYLKIADFGMAKILKNDEKATSFCGTPEYLSPEVITGEGHNSSADWWSYGILMYEMLCGIPPFYCDNTERMYELITHADLRFPKKLHLSDEAKDILKKLLVKDPRFRLGSKGGFDEIKQHPFFKGVDFDAILHKTAQPPFKPTLSGKYDIQNFDAEFTSESIVGSAIPERRLEYIKENQDLFEDFNK